MSDASADFTTMYRKYAPDVLRFAFYLSGEQSDAEDIASETFVRAWTSPTPIVAATVKAYLFTIARHLFLQRQRHDARRVTLDDHLVDRGLTPHAEAEHRDELDAVSVRVRRLPDVDRAAFLMRIDGSSYEDIASALGLTVGAARVKIHRARLTLAGIR